jgi:hypothetical protein
VAKVEAGAKAPDRAGIKAVPGENKISNIHVFNKTIYKMLKTYKRR